MPEPRLTGATDAAATFAIVQGIGVRAPARWLNRLTGRLPLWR